MPKLSWKPRRKGNIYCAPACGHGCTWKQYRDAKKGAKELCEHLEQIYGTKWKPDIWENLGWYYGARSKNGLLGVTPCVVRGKIVSYTAFLSDEPQKAGGVWAEAGRTALVAIRNTIKKALADVMRLNSAVIGAMDATSRDEGELLKKLEKALAKELR